MKWNESADIDQKTLARISLAATECGYDMFFLGTERCILFPIHEVAPLHTYPVQEHGVCVFFPDGNYELLLLRIREFAEGRFMSKENPPTEGPVDAKNILRNTAPTGTAKATASAVRHTPVQIHASPESISASAPAGLLTRWPFPHCQTDQMDGWVYPVAETDQAVPHHVELARQIIPYTTDAEPFDRQISDLGMKSESLREDVSAPLEERLAAALNVKTASQEAHTDALYVMVEDATRQKMRAEVILKRAEALLLQVQQSPVEVSEQDNQGFYVLCLPFEQGTEMRNVLFEIEQYFNPKAVFEEMGG